MSGVPARLIIASALRFRSVPIVVATLLALPTVAVAASDAAGSTPLTAGTAPTHTPIGSWTRVNTTGPSPRINAGMAYDAKDRYVLLFGGSNATSALNDTWTYRGGVWTQLHPVSSPSPRRMFAMAYDPAAGYVLFFGGTSNYGYSPVYNDTWTFAGGNWTELHLSKAPPPRWGASMVYDAATRSMLLFAGSSGPSSGSGIHDFWSFSNGSWSQLTLPTNPGQRNAYGFAYESSLGAAVLFGGWIPGGSCGNPTNETWLYRNGTWISHRTPAGLTPRQGPSLTYDPSLRADIEFGGNSGTCGVPAYSSDQTWVLNSSGAWSELGLASHVARPPARGFAATTYDAADGYVLMFGGAHNRGKAFVPLLGDTWTFS